MDCSNNVIERMGKNIEMTPTTDRYTFMKDENTAQTTPSTYINRFKNKGKENDTETWHFTQVDKII